MCDAPGLSNVQAEELAEMLLLLHEGETFGIARREPVAVGKVALPFAASSSESVI